MPLRIIYMGSPDFAIGPLAMVLKHGYQVVAVVTVPDKPAGRGQKLSVSPVKRFALEHAIPLLQPENLNDESVVQELKGFHPDLIIVVAFRIIPESIWKLPPRGTFNLHASLLPQYRGAAPINWVLINGETETGVTTFFLSHRVDTGNILFQERIGINPDETAGDLHDRLMDNGSLLVLKTVRAIESGDINLIDQQTLTKPGMVLKKAPKLQKEIGRLDWNNSALAIHNMIRGLSPSPCAYTELVSPSKDQSFPLKIYRSSLRASGPDEDPGHLVTDHKSYLGITAHDGLIYLEDVQMASKKRMPVSEFLKGFSIPPDMRAS